MPIIQTITQKIAQDISYAPDLWKMHALSRQLVALPSVGLLSIVHTTRRHLQAAAALDRRFVTAVHHTVPPHRHPPCDPSHGRHGKQSVRVARLQLHRPRVRLPPARPSTVGAATAALVGIAALPFTHALATAFALMRTVKTQEA